jgi:hypothetical protein
MPIKFKGENYYKTSEVARLAGDLPNPLYYYEEIRQIAKRGLAM